MEIASLLSFTCILTFGTNALKNQSNFSASDKSIIFKHTSPNLNRKFATDCLFPWYNVANSSLPCRFKFFPGTIHAKHLESHSNYPTGYCFHTTHATTSQHFRITIMQRMRHNHIKEYLLGSSVLVLGITRYPHRDAYHLHNCPVSPPSLQSASLQIILLVCIF